MERNTQSGLGAVGLVVGMMILVGIVWILYSVLHTTGGQSIPGENTAAAPEQSAAVVEADATAASTTPLATPTSTETTVTYSATGFSPKTVTIKKGETVVFENKTGKKVSIASDVHPTHLLYPEFDQYKTDQRGKDEFRFVFEKVGTWKYHDHLNATMTGVVVVTE